MDTLAILVAAGSGERLGAGRPKAFVPVAGQPMLLRAAAAFQAAPSVEAIIAVVPRAEVDNARALLATLPKLASVVAGGARRQDSVAEGLRQVPEDFEGIVLVHDAARPLVDVAIVESVCAAARETGAALPVLGLVDTIKRVREGVVTETLDRRELGAAQTPQGFRRSLLARAYAEAEKTGALLTDEATAVERLGHAVRAVAGTARNRKLTTRDDLAWAEDLLTSEDRRGTGHTRIGTGFDAHRLVAGRPLMLGGVRVEHARGLEGHSDGDCLVHAVCDALLGAAGAGDLGSRYPSSDPRWKDASSMVFLAEAAREVGERGYVVENVDATVIAEEPRLAPYTDRMRMRLSDGLRVPPEAVSVKAKSTDGLGPFGRGEGIAALCTLLLKRR
jgi:2-C-methyl-D-erythritol 4-phosphate cytidylyltransferase/2-C-methyl-D-erythritol 2,4-cyclodiphosphate synthase